MTEDLQATYETIDALQMRGDYDEILQIAEYARDAVANDTEPSDERCRIKQLEAQIHKQKEDEIKFLNQIKEFHQGFSVKKEG